MTGSPGMTSAVRIIADARPPGRAGARHGGGRSCRRPGSAPQARRGRAGDADREDHGGHDADRQGHGGRDLRRRLACLPRASQDVVLALRDDGRAARWAGRLVQGNLIPLPPAMAGLIATAMLAALGLRGLPGFIAMTPPVVMMLAAPGSSHPHDGRFDWLVPVLLALAQYVYLGALGFALAVPGPADLLALCADLPLVRRPRSRSPRRRHTAAVASRGSWPADRMGNPAVRRRPRRDVRPGHIRVPWARNVSWCARLPERPDRLPDTQGGRPPVIGMVLAAGTGRRLRPDTDGRPKALLPVAGETTILDIAIRNLAAAGLTEVVIVVGYAAGLVADRVPELERAYGVSIDLVHNDRAEEWNNAYSLWLAREYFGRGVLLVNGDTVHPVSVEKTLLAASAAAQSAVQPTPSASAASAGSPAPGRLAGGGRAARPPGPERGTARASARPRDHRDRRHQVAGRRGDEGRTRPRRDAAADHQGDGPGARPRRVHGRHADRAGRRRWPGRLAGDDLAARSRPVLRGRVRRVLRAGRRGPRGPDRRRGVGRGR